MDLWHRVVLSRALPTSGDWGKKANVLQILPIKTPTGKALEGCDLVNVIPTWKGSVLTCRQPSAGSAELVRPGGIVPNLSRSPSTRPNLSRSPSRRAAPGPYQGPRRFQAPCSELESFVAVLVKEALRPPVLCCESDWYCSNQKICL